MGLKQIIANKAQSCAVASLSIRNAQLLDDLSQNMRNSQRNHDATTNLKLLENKDSIRNLPRNYDATVQKTDAQLSPLKMPQKLRSENSELRGNLPTLSAIGGGYGSVISANNISNEAGNDHDESTDLHHQAENQVKAVDKVSTNGENLESVPENSGVKMSEVLLTSTHHPKSAVENSRLTQSEEAYPPTVDGQLTPMEEVTPTWLMDRYAHLITCQQCEHLTSTGYCRVKPQMKPIPEAMQDCGEFNQLKTERISIVNAPYTQMELKDLLGRDEKPLFQHLVDCRKCCLQDSHYCEDVFTIGSNYEDSLLCFDDADRKRESLLNAVVKARVTRRKVFVGYPNANVPPPC